MQQQIAEVKARTKSLGFVPINVVPLLNLWSVIGLQNSQRFNIQIERTDALRVRSIHRLVYRYSDRDPDKILSVDRRKV
jgi:hypothetical protein